MITYAAAKAAIPTRNDAEAKVLACAYHRCQPMALAMRGTNPVSDKRARRKLQRQQRDEVTKAVRRELGITFFWSPTLWWTVASIVWQVILLMWGELVTDAVTGPDGAD